MQNLYSVFITINPEGGAIINLRKYRKIVFLVALLLSINPFTFRAPALNKTAYSKTVLYNASNVLSYTFAQDQEEAFIRTVDRQISAFLQQEDKVLTIEGTDEIEFNELSGQFLMVDFRLMNAKPGSGNESGAIKGYQTELTLSGDPVYWRLDTKGKVYGVGNVELAQPEKLRELLPPVLQGIKAEFYTIRQRNNTFQVHMSLKNDGKDIGSYFSSQISRSSLPEELRELAASDNGIGTLELKANYEMDIPLVSEGENADKDTSRIKLKLTLVTHIKICND